MQLLLWIALGVHEPAHPAQLIPLYLGRVATLERQLGAHDPELARAMADAAVFLRSQGAEREALEMAGRALAVDESALGGDHRMVAADLELLASFAPAEAPALLDRALAIRAAHPPDLDLARLHSRLAAFYDGRGAPRVALDHYRAAVAAHERSLAKDEPGFAVALNDLGLALEGERKFRESETLYRRALAMQERRLGARHPEVGITLNNLAGALGATGRMAPAEPLLRRALGILDEKLGPEHMRSATCASNLADLLAATGRRGLARPLYERALRAFEKLGDQASAAQVKEAMGRGR